MSGSETSWDDLFDVHLPAELCSPESRLEGDLRNLSPGSVLFAADEPLRLWVEVSGERYAGRLVRSGAGVDGRWNFVVQLDQPLPVRQLVERM